MVHLRPTAVFVLLIAGMAVACGAQASADDFRLPRASHPWGRFLPGCWTKVRKTSEELDDKGAMRPVNTVETKTTLISADEVGFTLQIETTMEVAGKRFPPTVRSVHLGYHGESNGVAAAVTKMGDSTIEVGGESVACTVIRSEIKTASESIVATLHYASDREPYVFHRETQFVADDGEVRMDVSLEVLAVEMPFEIGEQLRPVAYSRTIEQHAQGSTVTIEVICLEVPGGVVSQASRDIDEAGNLIRQSTLELVDYQLAEGQPVFQRRRWFAPHRRSRVFKVPLDR